MPEGSCEGGALRWKEKNSVKGKDEGSPGFYLLYCLPRLAAESLDDQELEGVIHETVLHIERQTLRVYVCLCALCVRVFQFTSERIACATTTRGVDEGCYSRGNMSRASRERWSSLRQ